MANEIQVRLDPTTLRLLVEDADLAGKLTQTTSPITLWVDDGKGNDKNPGSKNKPLKTIEAAIDKVPFFIRINHPVTVNVKAGTYRPAAGALMISRVCEDYLTIQSVDWLAPSLSGSPTVGTFTLVNINDAVMNGATWIDHELKGKFVRMTSGKHAGKRFPIADNTSAGITLAMATSSGFLNEGFVLEEPGATIVGSTGRNTPIVLNTMGMPAHVPKVISPLVTLSGFKIRTSGLYTAYMCSMGPAGDRFLECMFIGNSDSRGICIVGAMGSNTLERCFLTTGEYLVSAARAGTVTRITGCVFTDAVNGLLIQLGKSILIDDTYEAYFQNLSNRAIENIGCIQFMCNRFVINTCGVGLYLSGSISLETDGMEILNCKGHGIDFSDDGTNNFNNNIHLGLDRVTIRGNGGDGVRIASRYSSIYFSDEIGASDISGNGGFGINMPAGIGCVNNSVLFSGAATMSGNVKGDICLDGSTVHSLADLRATADQKLADPVRSNMALAEGEHIVVRRKTRKTRKLALLELDG